MVRTLDGVCDDIPYCCNGPTAFVLLFDWPGRLFSNVWLRCALSSVFLPFLAGSGRAHESELQ